MTKPEQSDDPLVAQNEPVAADVDHPDAHQHTLLHDFQGLSPDAMGSSAEDAVDQSAQQPVDEAPDDTDIPWEIQDL
jgi:hypothetical protein